jgi:hypothetical protein
MALALCARVDSTACLKTAVSWDVALCSNISEELTASIIRVMNKPHMERLKYEIR